MEMRKVFTIGLTVALIVGLLIAGTGCSKSEVPEESATSVAVTSRESETMEEQEPIQTEEPTQSGSGSGTMAVKPSSGEPAFDGDAVLNNLEITPYQYDSGNYYYVFLVVKNNSELAAEITGDMTFFDADGNPVGVTSSGIEVLDPGCESIMRFNNESAFADYEYQLQASDNDYYDGVLSTLSCEVNLVDDKAILSVTNNGEKPARFVEYTTLFMSGDEIVGRDGGYCVDDDSEIKPGATQMAESRSFGEDFDAALVYLTGRAEK